MRRLQTQTNYCRADEARLNRLTAAATTTLRLPPVPVPVDDDGIHVSIRRAAAVRGWNTYLHQGVRGLAFPLLAPDHLVVWVLHEPDILFFSPWLARRLLA